MLNLFRHIVKLVVKMKSKLYLLFICYLVTISQINIFGKPVEVESKLYFSENPIIFDPPMIQKGNTHMIPIRSLLSYFDGTITQSKKVTPTQ